MVSLKSLVSGMSVFFLFSVFVVVPKCLSLLDVLGLSFFRDAGKQDYDFVTALAKIDKIASSEGDVPLAHALIYRFHIV
jgi:hypothetical protein